MFSCLSTLSGPFLPTRLFGTPAPTSSTYTPMCSFFASREQVVIPADGEEELQTLWLQQASPWNGQHEFIQISIGQRYVGASGPTEWWLKNTERYNNPIISLSSGSQRQDGRWTDVTTIWVCLFEANNCSCNYRLVMSSVTCSWGEA